MPTLYNQNKKIIFRQADDPKNNTIDLDTREKDLRQVPKRESIDENNSRLHFNDVCQLSKSCLVP